MMRRFTDRDRGSVTIWLALASFAMIVLVGLAVDLSGQVYAQQHAQDVARQGARAGGQQVDLSSAIHGTTPRTSEQAVAAARTYVSASDMEGTVAITNGGTTVVVTTSTVYQTKFLSIIGIKSLSVSGRSESDLVRVVNGARR